jgi:hypothetical protein
MSNNEDDAVKGRSEQSHAEFGNGEVEPKYARAERLDRPSAPVPEARTRPGLPIPAPGTAVAQRPRAPWLTWVLLSLLIVLLLVVIVILLLRPAGGGTAATTSASPTSTSTTSSRLPTTSLPTTSAATTTPTTGPSTKPAGGGTPSSATLTAGSYVDLDSMYPTTSATSEAEIKVGEDRISFGDIVGTWSKTRVVLVPKNGISRDACEKSTVLVTGGALLKSDITPDQSICISTSGGKWMALTSTDRHFSSDDSTWYEQYAFATQVFAGPQPT